MFVRSLTCKSENRYFIAGNEEDGQQHAECDLISALNQFSLTADQRPLIAALTDAKGQFQHSEIKSLKHRISLAMKLKTEPSETSCPLSISSHFEAVQAILNSVREEKGINELKNTLSFIDACPNVNICTTPLNKEKHGQLIDWISSAMDWATAVNVLKKWTEKMGEYLISFHDNKFAQRNK